MTVYGGLFEEKAFLSWDIFRQISSKFVSGDSNSVKFRQISSVRTVCTDRPYGPSVWTVRTDRPYGPSVRTVRMDGPYGRSVRTVRTPKHLFGRGRLKKHVAKNVAVFGPTWDGRSVRTDRPYGPSVRTVRTDSPYGPSVRTVRTDGI